MEKFPKELLKRLLGDLGILKDENIWENEYDVRYNFLVAFCVLFTKLAWKVLFILQ